MNSSTETIVPYLQILELETIPDREGLQKAFNRMIKKYHPDLNPHRKDWAHEQTRLLIEASGALKKHIDSGITWSGKIEFGEPEYDGDSVHRDVYETSASWEQKDPSSDSILIQLFGNENQYWAFFLKSIDRIVEFDPSKMKSCLEGQFYNLNGLFYPYVSLYENDWTGSVLDNGAIVLYGQESERIAFHVPSVKHFGEIISINRKEFIFRKNESGETKDVSFYHDLKCYRFPLPLVSEASRWV